MSDLLIHKVTKQQIEILQQRPSHAILLIGANGSGKTALAQYLAEAILALSAGSFTTYGYGKIIGPADGKAIGVEAVRDLEHFLSLKVPGTKSYDRCVIIEHSHKLTLEAQNALLKMLEEPPEGTILILTAPHERALLPTIRSRTQVVGVKTPPKSDLVSYFQAQGHDSKTINQAYAMSGGLPGLMHALLTEAEHPLLVAVEQARDLLQQSPFERLVSVDRLSKDKVLAADVLFLLQQMARISLQTASGPAAKKWQNVLKAAYETSEALAQSAQPKLALSHLMLHF
jgi:DNA polymerase-3 subunit delta'